MDEGHAPMAEYTALIEQLCGRRSTLVQAMAANPEQITDEQIRDLAWLQDKDQVALLYAPTVPNEPAIRQMSEFSALTGLGAGFSSDPYELQFSSTLISMLLPLDQLTLAGGERRPLLNALCQNV
jgi:hypothetical protein